MARNAPTFVCQNCGAVYGRWQGKCESCGEWNTIVEESAAADGGWQAPAGRPQGAAVRARAARRRDP
jgi:Predicted ATP-dependent serine protease